MKRALILGLMIAAMLVAANAQTPRRRTSTPIPAPTATPTGEATIVSRADDFPDDASESKAIPPDPNENRSVGADTGSLQTLEELGNRIKNLETARKPDPDEKQKRLLLNLDILTRAEQRSEALRKQVFEMIEKENATKTRIDSLDYDLRPESIDRNAALIGSLRPEEIRAARKKSLESERANLQSLLTEIVRTRASLEISLQRADALVERLRLRFEKEIETALDEDLENATRPN